MNFNDALNFNVCERSCSQTFTIMKNYLYTILIYGFYSISLTSYAQFTYISPVPGSTMHNKETNIILRIGDFVEAASITPALFSVYGSVSGPHTIQVKVAADNKSILVRSTQFFSSGEKVTVTVSDGIRNSDGKSIHGTTFHFEIRPDQNPEEQRVANQA